MQNLLRGAKARERFFRWSPILLMLLVFVPIHLLVHPLKGDDIGYVRALGEPSLWQWLIARYGANSSRLIIEAVMMLVMALPVAVWQALDILVILALYAGLLRLFARQEEPWSGLLMAVLLCCYPFFHMGSAGWRTTTLNYLWPLAGASWSIVFLRRVLLGQPLRWFQWIAGVLLLLFSSSHELVAVILLCTFLAGLVQAVRMRRPLVYAVVGLCIATAHLVFFLVSPGNAERIAFETARWMPEFADFTFLDKLRVGLVTTFEYLLTPPNILLLMFSLLLAFQGVPKAGNLPQKALCLLPACLIVGFTAYYIAADVLASYLGVDLPRGGNPAFQAVLVAGILAFILSTIAALYVAYGRERDFWASVYVLALGFACRMALMLSPTVIASGMRTYLFLYIGVLCAAFLLWRRTRARWQNILLWSLGAVGILMNLWYVYLHP